MDHTLTDGSQWSIGMEKPEADLLELKTAMMALVASETSD